MPARLGEADLLDRYRGCWLGKIVGHTLGAPHAGLDTRPDVVGLAEGTADIPPCRGLSVERLTLDVVRRSASEAGTPRAQALVPGLVDAWVESVHLSQDEYGPALRNLQRGLRPPVSGWYDNWFLDCTGALERATVWACLAPGSPTVAARLAYHDATIDHSEDGVHAAVFLAAALSAAFVLEGRRESAECGLAILPSSSRVARAVGLVRDGCARGTAWTELRERIVEEYGHPNHTQAPQNVALIVLAWLSHTDFASAVCRAVNCGKATDVTAAAVGAWMGIRYGGAAIESEWADPVADRLPPVVDVDVQDGVATIRDLARRTLEAARIVADHDWAPTVIVRGRSDVSDVDPLALVEDEELPALLDRDPREVVFPFTDGEIRVNYMGAPTIPQGGSKTVFLSAHAGGAELRDSRVSFTSLSTVTAGPRSAQPATSGAYVLASARGRAVEPENWFEARLDWDGGSETVRFPLLAETCWWVCGPFEGADPSALRTPLGPDRDPREGVWWQGRDDARVRFERVAFPESHMNLEHWFAGRPGVLFLASEWHAEQALDGAVAIACSGGFRARIGDRPLARKEEPESPLSMRRLVLTPVRLREGWTRVVLKIVRYDEPMEFVYQFRDRAGRPLQGLSACEWRPLGGEP